MTINLFLVLAIVGLGLFLVLPRWLAFILYLPILAAYLYTTWTIWQVRHLPPVTGREAMMGGRATVVRTAGGLTQVQYRGEVWQAVCARPLQPGQEVVIQAVEGLTLVVAPLPSYPPANGEAKGGV